jgi:outer membrane protein assembly factor BamD
MPRVRFLLLGLLLLGGLLPAARAELTWRPGEGWTDESGGEGATAASSRDQLALAHKLEAQGQRDDALKAYKTLLRRWPLSFFAPEAQFRVGKIMEDEADYYNSFQAFQKMVTKYPSSAFFDEALGEQYRIANLYLAGEPQRLWKIPVGPSMDKTVDMYDRIIKNAPYGTYAAESQFKIGLAREKQRRYTDAIDAYQKILDNYPTSSVAANAQYQIGYAWMRAASNADYDQSAAKKAVDAFQDYLVRYPNSDKDAQAQDNIQKLSSKQTQGAYNIAQFYQTQHDPRAAFIYYNEVVREDPNSPQAQEAKKHIQELRPVVQAMPGGLAADGTPGMPAQTVASGPQPPAPAPVDPNAPAPTKDVPVENPTPASSTNAPAAAPVAAPPDSTPLPQ